jgi:hypothetical protein
MSVFELICILASIYEPMDSPVFFPPRKKWIGTRFFLLGPFKGEHSSQHDIVHKMFFVSCWSLKEALEPLRNSQNGKI